MDESNYYNLDSTTSLDTSPPSTVPTGGGTSLGSVIIIVLLIIIIVGVAFAVYRLWSPSTTQNIERIEDVLKKVNPGNLTKVQNILDKVSNITQKLNIDEGLGNSLAKILKPTIDQSTATATKTSKAGNVTLMFEEMAAKSILPAEDKSYPKGVDGKYTGLDGSMSRLFNRSMIEGGSVNSMLNRSLDKKGGIRKMFVDELEEKGAIRNLLNESLAPNGSINKYLKTATNRGGDLTKLLCNTTIGPIDKGALLDNALVSIPSKKLTLQIGGEICKGVKENFEVPKSMVTIELNGKDKGFEIMDCHNALVAANDTGFFSWPKNAFKDKVRTKLNIVSKGTKCSKDVVKM